MVERGSTVERWTWARPDVRTYALMVQRLAASPRVSDAIKILSIVSRMGVSNGEEVMRQQFSSCFFSFKSTIHVQNSALFCVAVRIIYAFVSLILYDIRMLTILSNLGKILSHNLPP